MVNSSKAERELNAALSAIRAVAGADLALVYCASNGHPLTCVAAEFDGAARPSYATAGLIGSALKLDQKQANARRQNRQSIVPTADLPASTTKGTRLGTLDVSPWAMLLPLAP